MTNKNNLPAALHEITTQNELLCQFDEENGVLLLDIKKPFNANDFAAIANIIDPYFSSKGELGGVIINSKKFPYWKGSTNRAQYLDFAKNNHYKFKKSALNMGGFFVMIIARIANGRAHPKIKTFKYNQIEQAQDWILSAN
jgi:hypothetical protein